MIRLRDKVNETVRLAVPDALDCMVVVDRVDSSHAVRTFHEIGDISPLHATASTIVPPAATAGPIVRVPMASGKFHGVMSRHGPTGRRISSIRSLALNKAAKEASPPNGAPAPYGGVRCLLAVDAGRAAHGITSWLLGTTATAPRSHDGTRDKAPYRAAL